MFLGSSRRLIPSSPERGAAAELPTPTDGDCQDASARGSNDPPPGQSVVQGSDMAPSVVPPAGGGSCYRATCRASGNIFVFPERPTRALAGWEH
eukprot:502301-Alexandrium_andersonii.AAC.1